MSLIYLLIGLVIMWDTDGYTSRQPYAWKLVALQWDAINVVTHLVSFRLCFDSRVLFVSWMVWGTYCPITHVFLHKIRSCVLMNDKWTTHTITLTHYVINPVLKYNSLKSFVFICINLIAYLLLLVYDSRYQQHCSAVDFPL